jgi:hypothetical protein
VIESRETKEQDHLKKTSLGPLRQGQRLDTSETKLCSRKKNKPPKHTRAPTAHMQDPLEQVPTLDTNRSGRLPKPVRPITKTGQTDYQNRSGWLPKPVRLLWYSRPHPQKPKMQKKHTSSSLTLGIGSRDAMQLFSTFLSPPCCQCMNQGSNSKICNLELLRYTKFITRCYTFPNEARIELSNFAESYPLMSKVLKIIKTCQNGKATQTSC